ncbi:unnamed protein product [Dicrocoelium dendriticum]|nr:unnamed protein product [Dicrocoelium dendriticum]
MDFGCFCRGILFGGLIGDCYGFVYEDKPRVTVDIPLKLLADTESGKETSQLDYTDDTQMGLATLRSLRDHESLVPEDLARQYAHDFFSDGSHRYYGGSVPRVFSQLQENNFQAPYQPAAAQFNGTGSYGNGGAMRSSFPALFGIHLPDVNFADLIINITRLTHTHPLAIYGALLQAFAVRQLWDIVSKPNQALVPDDFLDQLLTLLKQLVTVKSLLSLSAEPSVEEVVSSLGNDLKAINSVPTALYAFLRSLKPIEGIPLMSIPLRCLVYCISLGGDTDTIGTMACSLAGGFVGIPTKETGSDSPIPKAVLARCEALSVLADFAEWFATRCST